MHQEEVGSKFDESVSDYETAVDDAVSFAKKNARFFLGIKAQAIEDLASQHLGDAKKCRALDVGCGIGLLTAELASSFSSLTGVDISERSIQQATERVPTATFEHYEGSRLPFDDQAFDLCFASCVMHHVPPASWHDFANERRRVTRVGGLVCICEHNPFNPLTRLVVHRCELDKDAVLLRRGAARAAMRKAGLRVLPSPYILFFPFAGRFFRTLESGLRWCPMGAQYIAVGSPRQ